jgi:hypothetical protein
VPWVIFEEIVAPILLAVNKKTVMKREAERKGNGTPGEERGSGDDAGCGVERWSGGGRVSR